MTEGEGFRRVEARLHDVEMAHARSCQRLEQTIEKIEDLVERHDRLIHAMDGDRGFRVRLSNLERDNEQRIVTDRNLFIVLLGLVAAVVEGLFTRFMKAFAFVFCLSSIAEAQQFTGYSAYPALSPQWNTVQPGEQFSMCDRFLYISEFAERPIMAVLWGTFDGGNPDMRCVERFVSTFSNKPHAIQIHLLNENGRGHGRLLEGEFLPGVSTAEFNHLLESLDLFTFLALSDRIFAVREAFERLTNENSLLLISSGLEARYSQLAARHITDHIKAAWPGVMVVGNPLNAVLGDVDVFEVHGKKVCKTINCLASEDGIQQSFSASCRWLKNNRRGLASLIWDWEGQGRPGTDWLPPLQRDFRMTDDRMIEAAILLMVCR